MIRYFLVILSTFLVACGSQHNLNSDDIPLQPSDLKKFVEEYESFYNIDVNYPVVVESSRTGSSSGGYVTIGICYLYSDGSKLVVLNQKWWESQTSENAKRVLVYHELTHCSLYRGHDERKFENGMPTSIMYPVINSVLNFFDKYSRYYLDEIATPYDPDLTLTQSFTTTSSSCEHNYQE